MRFFLILPLLALLSLAACYHPLYGGKDFSGAPNGQEKRLNSIFIGAIDGEGGQKLRNNLIDRMYTEGRPAHGAYRLEVVVKVEEEHLGLKRNTVSTRARMDISATYTLYNSANNKKLFTGANHSVEGYNLLDEAYATLAAREDGLDRAYREIADLMVNRLLVYLGEGK